MKRVVLLSVLVLILSTVYSQDCVLDNPSKTKFGFHLGGGFSKMFSASGASYPKHNEAGPSFLLGINMEYQFAGSWWFAPKVDLTFHDTYLSFNEINNGIEVYDIYANVLNIIPHFKKSFGKGKADAYLVLGPEIKLPLDSRLIDKPKFGTNVDVAINVGVGLDMNMKYFTFMPELRYSHGFFGVNDPASLSPIKLHNVSLIFGFI